jgi:hypothetical protein
VWQRVRAIITVASIKKGTEFDSLWGHIKAVTADLLIKPEALPPAEDVKKVERRLISE